MLSLTQQVERSCCPPPLILATPATGERNQRLGTQQSKPTQFPLHARLFGFATMIHTQHKRKGTTSGIRFANSPTETLNHLQRHFQAAGKAKRGLLAGWPPEFQGPRGDDGSEDRQDQSWGERLGRGECPAPPCTLPYISLLQTFV